MVNKIKAFHQQPVLKWHSESAMRIFDLKGQDWVNSWPSKVNFWVNRILPVHQGTIIFYPHTEGRSNIRPKTRSQKKL